MVFGRKWAWFAKIFAVAQARPTLRTPLHEILDPPLVDYIITDAISAPLVHSCSILDHDPPNTSDHLPLSITLACETQFKHNNASPRAHLNWKRGLCDGSVDLFVAGINNLYDPSSERTIYTSPLELNEEVRSVSESIISIASSSIPHFKPRKPIHDTQLQHLSTKCKVAWRKWCEAGRPKQGPLFEDKNTLK